MINDLVFRQTVAMAVAATLLLLPFSQTMACERMSHTPNPHQSDTGRQQPSKISTTQANINNSTKSDCHNRKVSDSLSATGINDKSAHSGCDCEASCCQGIINILSGIAVERMAYDRPHLLPQNLLSLKPDFISYPHNPPPIIS